MTEYYNITKLVIVNFFYIYFKGYLDPYHAIEDIIRVYKRLTYFY